jgi:hypothetical protein
MNTVQEWVKGLDRYTKDIIIPVPEVAIPACFRSKKKNSTIPEPLPEEGGIEMPDEDDEI